MAAIKLSQNQVVCVLRGNIVVFDLGGCDKTSYSCEKPKLSAQDARKQPQGNEDGTDVILTSGFSPSGRYFVACDDYKQLTTWRVEHVGQWEKLATRTLARRATSLTFTKDESTVLVGDKSGDVSRFSTLNCDEAGELLMGHVSMLLDLVLCDGDRFVATGDRDEKIRVSHFPNCFSIHSFCLGHTDFVSQLAYLQEEDVLVSGSGDGTLRLWNYKSGIQLHCIQCCDQIQEKVENLKDKAEMEEPEKQQATESDEESDQEKEMDVQSGTTDSNLESKRSDGLDLKRLACCQKQKLIAVGFERLPLVLLYKFQNNGDLGPTLTFIQKLLLQGPLWDVTFDHRGHLWVLQTCEACPLVVYERDNITGQMIQLDAGKDSEDIGRTVTAVNKEWNLFKECVGQEGIFSVLHKVKIDNAKFYQERKQQKLEEHKQRYREKLERKKHSKQVVTPGECDKNEEQEAVPPMENSEIVSQIAGQSSPVAKKIKSS